MGLTGTPHVALRRRRTRRASPGGGFGLIGLAVSIALGIWMADTGPTKTPDDAGAAIVAATAPSPAQAPPAQAPAGEPAWLDPAPSFGRVPAAFAQNAPLGSDFVALVLAAPAPAAVLASAEPLPPAEPQSLEAVPPPPPVVIASRDVPLPTPRPPEFQTRVVQGAMRAVGRLSSAWKRTAAAAVAPDNRSFFEKLFGAPAATGPMLAYAAPESSLVDAGRRSWSAAPSASSASSAYDRWTAVYDITAHTVTLPDGTRLEAHSGYGDKLDDPRHVSVRMRGATPPNVYALAPREQLFHGVRALRLSPVGGGGTFGRTGLLAHTYMLGPNGDSNGCVSFRNYDAFLQAFLSGQVKRLAVVARQS